LGGVVKSALSASFAVLGDGKKASVGRGSLGLNIGERTASTHVLVEESGREVKEPELKDSDELRGEEILVRLSGDSVEEREELWKVSEGILSLTESANLGEGGRTGLLVRDETAWGATALQCK